PFTNCPHCNSSRFHPGPQGGRSCVGCAARFNIVLPTIMRPDAPVLLVNELSPPSGEPPNPTVAAYIIELLSVRPNPSSKLGTIGGAPRCVTDRRATGPIALSVAAT